MVEGSRIPSSLPPGSLRGMLAAREPIPLGMIVGMPDAEIKFRLGEKTVILEAHGLFWCAAVTTRCHCPLDRAEPTAFPSRKMDLSASATRLPADEFIDDRAEQERKADDRGDDIALQAAENDEVFQNR